MKSFAAMTNRRELTLGPVTAGKKLRWPVIGLLAGLGTALLFLIGGQAQALPSMLATGAAAPLDTLRESGASTEVDIRYRGAADVSFSRRLLPNVQATSIPQASTPQTPPRMDDPAAAAWHFHMADLAETDQDVSAVKEHLKAALQADPQEPRYILWQMKLALMNADLVTTSHALPDYIKALLASPLAANRLLLQSHQAALLIIAIFWTVLVAALTLVWWRHLAHDLTALLLKDYRHTARVFLPLILPVAFMLLKPGWLGFLAFMSIPLLAQARGGSRALLVSVWATAVILVFPNWHIMRSAVPAIDPGSEAVLLANASHWTPDAGIMNDLKERLATAQDPGRRSRLASTLGIMEARFGYFKRSNELFRESLHNESDNFTALVGLANNTYYQGDLDRAIQGYEEAARLHPDRGEIPYNMAQVYFKKLFVPEAADALQMARDKGFAPPSWNALKNHPDVYSPVVYPGLTAKSMRAACSFEADNYQPLVSIAAWQTYLGDLPFPLFLVLGVPLLLGLTFIAWGSKQNDPRSCENCGTPICKDCCRVRDEAWLCPSCGETADRARSNMILATLLRNRSRTQVSSYTRKISWLGRIWPGAGHLAIGRTNSAVLRMTIVTLGLFLAAASWSFKLTTNWFSPGLILQEETINQQWLPLPLEQWPGWTAGLVLCGCGLLGLAWALALADGKHLRHMIPERFSLVPTLSPNRAAGDSPPPPGASNRALASQREGVGSGLP